MSKMIDGNALVMSLTDWWYSSFGQEETEESKAIKTVVDEVEKYVDGYPTYEPERKKGEWIETEFLKLRECSCCHVRWGMYDVENFNFCPNCGADMTGE